MRNVALGESCDVPPFATDVALRVNAWQVNAYDLDTQVSGMAPVNDMMLPDTDTSGGAVMMPPYPPALRVECSDEVQVIGSGSECERADQQLVDAAAMELLDVLSVV